MNRKLLIATNNAGKVTELRGLLSGSDLELISLKDLSEIAEVEETGETFSENAALKAIGYARATGLVALADDSGLAVNALDGRPGVLSARYGGDGTDFAKKMELLLEELKITENNDRGAKFVCCIAVASPNGELLFSAEGVCEGQIAESPYGNGGFGYDPIFIPTGFDLTFGQLDQSIKQKISHRSKAFEQIIPFLRHFNAG